MPETIYRMIRLSFLRLLSSFQNISDMLRTGDATKTDEFSEKFQTAFDPQPPTFSENHAANLSGKRPKKICLRVQNLFLFVFGLKMPLLPPPPLELFRKFIRFGTVTRP